MSAQLKPQQGAAEIKRNAHKIALKGELMRNKQVAS